MECLIDKAHIADILQDIKPSKMNIRKIVANNNETSLYNTHISENNSQSETASTYAKHVPFTLLLTHFQKIPNIQFLFISAWALITNFNIKACVCVKVSLSNDFPSADCAW